MLTYMTCIDCRSLGADCCSWRASTIRGCPTSTPTNEPAFSRRCVISQATARRRVPCTNSPRPRLFWQQPSAPVVAFASGYARRAALRLDQTDSDVGAFTLRSLVSRCVDCGRCVALCPSGVLVRTDQVNWAQLLDDTLRTVATGSVRRCAHCGGNFAGSEASQYCPPCLFRVENPFGSRGPVPSPKLIATGTGAPR